MWVKAVITMQIMASYTGRRIDCWVVGEEVKRDSQLSIYKVYNEKNSEEKYLMAIYQDLLANPNELDEDDDSCLLPVNLNCRPIYTYYDSHCFPVIPPSNSCGSYNGNEYFVFEKVSRSLSSIVSDASLDVSDNDLVVTAYQILEILRILFDAQKVLKNLHVNDFFFRRTTKGYRTVLLNQDFVTKECFFIEDPTFTSVSVMSGNEPTPTDNLQSLAYILIFLSQGTLPWLGRTDAEIKAMKENPALMQCSPFEGSCTPFLSRLDVVPLLLSSADPRTVLDQCLQLLRERMTSHTVTFGRNVDSFTKKSTRPAVISSLERIQPQAPAPPQTPVKPAPVSTPAPVSPNRVVVVAGQRYEVKVVNGKRLMEPIGSPVPPVRSARKKLHPAGIVINPQGVPEDSVPEATPVVVPEALPVEPVKVRREKRGRTLSEAGSKRRKTQRIESRSIVTRANRFFTSSLFSSFLFTAAVLAIESMH
ncbi:hypothetical protein AV274_0348 [Blastocystis sp. ATCC 50177/Nand II]|uniref:Protein kinase domain-containing protein n=1 Tax=Blastocystis sp. subtype 1 (strain ATCC 50177 / NandII) TaxID=478820 RepID=A0A196SNX8_BLAHN|nr:hypothetical protein AV274_0348 [Blastocystis sp. ATCC 50177/Nand II]